MHYLEVKKGLFKCNLCDYESNYVDDKFYAITLKRHLLKHRIKAYGYCKVCGLILSSTHSDH